MGLLVEWGYAIVVMWQIGHQLTKGQAMTTAATTAAAAKAARKAANKALTQELRDLVAAGKADQAMALVQNKPASWAQIVTDAEARRIAKAAKAAEEPKGKGKGKPAAAAEAAPAVSGDVAALMQQVQALQEALQALTAPAPAAPAKPKRRKAAATEPVEPTAWIDHGGVSGEFFTISHETALKGLAFLSYGKVGQVVKGNDAQAISAARAEARQCAAWCDQAQGEAETIAERDRLQKKAAIYRECVARLSK